MEKRTPHCKLAVVKTMLASGMIRITVSALAGGAALGFGFEEIIGVIAALTPRDFYRSMTTHADHRIWQDDYRRTRRVLPGLRGKRPRRGGIEAGQRGDAGVQ